MTRQSAIEALESRIAPAITVFHPIPDIVAGVGKTGATIDLEALVDEVNGTHRTLVRFTTNFKLPGQTENAVIELELFDDKAPLTVQNFLTYLNNDSYDGTFFHRIFDFGSNSEPGRDIIQAGGFDVTNLTAHIPTGLTVHNEFNPDDPEVQNTRGTIAMAKTALSPDTATSEWFINLTNNSTILGGNNNGGFTVFGKITDESLAVVDAIGQATTINRNGALTDLPVRDYPAGGTSAPTEAQLFKIESAEIIAPAETNAAGYTFTVQDTVPGSSNDSPLLTWSISSANKLTLNYVAGQTGQADVTVTINKDGETPVTDTFRVTVNPNLITEVASHTLLGQFAKDDKGKSSIVLSNNGAGIAKGTVKLQLFLSEVIRSGNDVIPPTFDVDENDILLEEKSVEINIASGESATFSLKFDVEYKVNDKVLIHGKQYVVVARVDTSAASFDELFPDDDNDGGFQSGHVFNLATGTIGARKNVPLTLDGVTYSLKGNGTAVLVPNEDGSYDLNVSGTDARTSFTVKTPSGVPQDIEDINILNTIGKLNLGNVTLHGDFAASGGAKSIVFGDLVGGGIDRTISINAFPGSGQKLALSFDDVTDYSLASSMPISKLTAKSWMDTETTTSSNQIFTNGLGSLRVTGDLEASVFNATAQKIALIHVGGALNGVTVKSLGDIGSVKLGSMTSSNLFAGLSQKPNDLGDFSEGRTISSLKVAGTVSDSVIAAAKFNSIVLGSVDTAAGTSVKGIYADAIKSYLRKGPDGTKLTRLDGDATTPEEPAKFDANDKYEVAVF